MYLIICNLTITNVFNYSDDTRQGTGFIGRLDGEPVLVTCYHVIVESMRERDDYLKEKTASKSIKEGIEKHAKSLSIKVNNKKFKLKDIIVDGTTKISPQLSV